MRFFFHYNKPASRKAGEPVISLHFGGKCHLVSNVDVGVPTKGRVRKATQPRFVVAGEAGSIELVGGVGVIR